MKPDLDAQLRARGYRYAVILGPFGGRTGDDEYTIELYDASGRVWQRSLRGTYPALREQIAQLPEQEPPPATRRS